MTWCNATRTSTRRPSDDGVSGNCHGLGAGIVGVPADLELRAPGADAVASRLACARSRVRRRVAPRNADRARVVLLAGMDHTGKGVLLDPAEAEARNGE